MRYQRLFLLCAIIIAAFLPQSSHACTTFCLDSNEALVVGKNFDWTPIDALIVVNKRNVTKTAWVNPDSPEKQPASWTSKYGSVTFNSWGREFPYSGMNEAGLVVSPMLLSLTEYPTPDARPAISTIQWVQYQLDTAATVADVIASDAVLRISNRYLTSPRHFFVCDSQGHCASIEFLHGVLVYHTQETMPLKVLANNSYSGDLGYWENEEIPVPNMYSSAQRFCTAAEMLEDYDPETSGSAVDYTFNILSNVSFLSNMSQGLNTRWSIAYDIQNQRINFYTLDNGEIRYCDMNSFDFSCQTPVKVLDIQADLSGDISDNFIDYTYEINRDLVEKASAIFNQPDEVLDALAAYPDTTECGGACELYIEHRKIQYAKLSKDRKVVLKITGDDDFDRYSRIDLGPLSWRKASFNRKKNRLKVRAIVPAGLRPGIVPIWVGDCFGEIEVLP